jgi:hypothetical protein
MEEEANNSEHLSDYSSFFGRVRQKIAILLRTRDWEDYAISFEEGQYVIRSNEVLIKNPLVIYFLPDELVQIRRTRSKVRIYLRAVVDEKEIVGYLEIQCSSNTQAKYFNSDLFQSAKRDLIFI